MGHAFRFRADLAGARWGNSKVAIRTGPMTGFYAIQGEIPGGADEWQQGGNDTLDRKLEQFDRADAGGAYTEGDQFGPDRDPAVAKQAVAESHVHGFS
jgi:hypothetical protein